MPIEPDPPEKADPCIGPSSQQSPEAQITTLRKRVADCKQQARLLFERFERGEISRIAARTEAERLGRVVGEAERQVEQLAARRRSRG